MIDQFLTYELKVALAPVGSQRNLASAQSYRTDCNGHRIVRITVLRDYHSPDGGGDAASRDSYGC